MNHHHQQQQEQSPENMPMGTGLTRYRSAPSSYFASLLNSNHSGDGDFGVEDFEQLLNPKASTPETQRIFPSDSNLQSQFQPPRKNEPETQLQRQQSNDYSSVSQIVYRTHDSEAKYHAAENSFTRMSGSIDSNPVAQMKIVEGSSLVRQSSSPAELFGNINIKNNFGAARGIGNFGANAELASFSSAGRLKSRMDFSSSSGMMDPENNPGEGGLDEDRDSGGSYIPDFPINSWHDSGILSDNFLKRVADKDNETFASDDQHDNEGGNRVLSHHLSLPKSYAQLSPMEKLLQDSVPCKIRAKRGFATHPRSIAERVRRTKISERMRRLQELVPNMEKQTNTADMLDLAVDYIKDLQRQVKTLSDVRANCVCSAKHN